MASHTSLAQLTKIIAVKSLKVSEFNLTECSSKTKTEKETVPQM